MAFESPCKNATLSQRLLHTRKQGVTDPVTKVSRNTGRNGLGKLLAPKNRKIENELNFQRVRYMMPAFSITAPPHAGKLRVMQQARLLPFLTLQVR